MLKINENGTDNYYDDFYDLFYQKMKTREVDYLKLNNAYVRYLRDKENSNMKQISEIDMPLMNTIKPMKHLKGKINNDAIYRYLVKYERFKGAPVWEELVEYVKDNNLNLNGSYFNDLYLEKEEK